MKATTDRRGDRRHPAWKILIACCCLYGATAGMINNCRGLFYTSAAEGIGVSATAYANYLTFGSIAGVLAMPLIANLFKKLPIKPILVAIMAVLGASTSALGAAKTLNQCYIIGAVQGVVCSFAANFPAVYLVKQWFVKKKGLAMGLATASAGIMGSIMNPLLDYGLHTIGWRATYGALGLCCFLLGAIPVLLFVHRRPEDIGLAPYGGEDMPAETAAIGQPTAPMAPRKSQGLSHRDFALFLPIALMHAVFSLSNAYLQHIPTFANAFGLATTVGTHAISIAMLVGVAIKLLYGMLSDRIGIYRTAAIMTAPVAAAFYFLMTCNGDAATITLVGALISPLFALIAVQGPMMLDSFFRGSAYDTLLAGLVTIAALFSSGGNVIVSLLYNLGGKSYHLGHAIMFCLALVCILLYFVLWRINTRQAAVQAERVAT